MTSLVEDVRAVGAPTGPVALHVRRRVRAPSEPPPRPSTPVALAVVSDSPVVRHGVVEMLRPWPDRVSTTVHGWHSCEPVPVDAVTLADTGSCATRAVTLAEHPGRGPVVVLGRDLSPDELRRALDSGCAGHVDLGASASQLLRAVERAHRSCGPAVPDRWPGKAHGLSRREADALVLVCQGLTNQDIAQRLDLTLNTVKSYVRTAYQKIGVARRAEAVRWGIQNGLLALPVVVADDGQVGRLTARRSR